jgi:hypothetical protein
MNGLNRSLTSSRGCAAPPDRCNAPFFSFDFQDPEKQNPQPIRRARSARSGSSQLKKVVHPAGAAALPHSRGCAPPPANASSFNPRNPRNPRFKTPRKSAVI